MDDPRERVRQLFIALPLALLVDLVERVLALLVVVERLEREEGRAGVEQLQKARGLRLIGDGFTFGNVFVMGIALC